MIFKKFCMKRNSFGRPEFFFVNRGCPSDLRQKTGHVSIPALKKQVRPKFTAQEPQTPFKLAFCKASE
jgi:hypothetical protein